MIQYGKPSNVNWATTCRDMSLPTASTGLRHDLALAAVLHDVKADYVNTVKRFFGILLAYLPEIWRQFVYKQTYGTALLVVGQAYGGTAFHHDTLILGGKTRRQQICPADNAERNRRVAGYSFQLPALRCAMHIKATVAVPNVINVSSMKYKCLKIW